MGGKGLQAIRNEHHGARTGWVGATVSSAPGTLARRELWWRMAFGMQAHAQGRSDRRAAGQRCPPGRDVQVTLTVIDPKPSTLISISSPFCTGPTPEGVPDRITSPGASS